MARLDEYTLLYTFRVGRGNWTGLVRSGAEMAPELEYVLGHRPWRLSWLSLILTKVDRFWL